MMLADLLASVNQEICVTSINQVWLWIIFNCFILVMLSLDLGVFHRNKHAIQLKEALLWVTFWIALALTFNIGIYVWRGPHLALQFLTGYLIEYSLSVDNIFVFLLIFSYFRVPAAYQHKVLFWGILGALIMRAAFIVAGIALLKNFHVISYLFGGFLILAGLKMIKIKGQAIHPEKNLALRILQRFMPITAQYQGDRFAVRQHGRWLATPLLAVLLVLETSDIIFAIDSIPAILSISTDPFIVYSSNVFAILGLRALYFALAGMLRRFHQLHYGLSIILIFVGVKMLLADYYPIPIGLALGFIVSIISLSILSSLIWPRASSDKNK